MMTEAQAVPIDIHFHHAWLIWLLYFCGAGLHIILQIDDIARKNNWTRRNVLNAIGSQVAFRNFFSAMIFGLLWYYPLLISNALAVLGHPVGQDEAAVLAIPMNNFIAGLYGTMLDSLLGYIPGLKSWLPTVAPVPKP